MAGLNSRHLFVSEVRYTKSGDDGRFSFKDLKGRQVPARRRSDRRPVSARGVWPTRSQAVVSTSQLQQDRPFKDGKLEMAPTGAITGRVTDENGQPIGHAPCFRPGPTRRERRRYLTVIAAVIPDDKGNYRLFWLPPGRLLVAARLEDLSRRTVGLITTPPGRLWSNEDISTPILSRRLIADRRIGRHNNGLRLFRRSSRTGSCEAVGCASGEKHSRAPIFRSVSDKMPAWHIRGTVLDASGQPAKGAGLRAIPRQWSPNIQVLTGTTDPNGNFDLIGAVQGSYAVFATTQASLISQKRSGLLLPAVCLDPRSSGSGKSRMTGLCCCRCRNGQCQRYQIQHHARSSGYRTGFN
jgi:hypothetical protein